MDEFLKLGLTWFCGFFTAVFIWWLSRRRDAICRLRALLLRIGHDLYHSERSSHDIIHEHYFPSLTLQLKPPPFAAGIVAKYSGLPTQLSDERATQRLIFTATHTQRKTLRVNTSASFSASSGEWPPDELVSCMLKMNDLQLSHFSSRTSQNGQSYSLTGKGPGLFCC